jgi:hypothetical protein
MLRKALWCDLLGNLSEQLVIQLGLKPVLAAIVFKLRFLNRCKNLRRFTGSGKVFTRKPYRSPISPSPS